MNEGWSACMCERKDTSTYTQGYLSLFAHEAPVCLTYMCRWLSSALFARSRSLTMCVCVCVCQDPATPRVSPAHSPPENGLDKSRVLKKDGAPNSPASVASSGSTPSSKAKDHAHVSAGEPRGRSKPGFRSVESRLAMSSAHVSA